MGADREKWFKMAAEQFSCFVFVNGVISCIIDLLVYRRWNLVFVVNILVIITLIAFFYLWVYYGDSCEGID